MATNKKNLPTGFPDHFVEIGMRRRRRRKPSRVIDGDGGSVYTYLYTINLNVRIYSTYVLLVPKNIKKILGGKATCRLHRKSPIEYSKKLMLDGRAHLFSDSCQ
jgi:hypothetical protein